MDDPRFANKFGGGGNSGSPLTTNRRAESLSGIPTIGQSEAEKKKAAKLEEEKRAKEEKAAKAKAKAEAEARAKAELEAVKIAAKAKEDEAKVHAVTALATGKKGEDLKNEIAGMDEKPTGAALIANVLAGLDDRQSYGWVAKEEYGEALAFLVAEDAEAQFKLINEVVKFCNDIKFPKIEVKSGTRALIEVIFQLFYKFDIIDASGFNRWWSDEDEDEAPGRHKAIIQTTTFMTWLNEDDESEGEDEDDDDDSLEPPPNNNNMNN
jgi:predicted  nucleic acid-binding Zn-ribbon protein